MKNRYDILYPPKIIQILGADIRVCVFYCRFLQQRIAPDFRSGEQRFFKKMKKNFKIRKNFEKAIDLHILKWYSGSIKVYAGKRHRIVL